MYHEIITSQTFNNTVFEGRNQNYGAYQLRMNYEHNVKKAFSILLFFVALFIGLSFLKFKTIQVVDKLLPATPTVFSNVDLPKIPKTIPAKKVIPPTPPVENKGHILPTKIDKDKNVNNKTTEKTDPEKIGNPNGKENPTTNPIIPNPTPQPTGGGITGGGETKKLPIVVPDVMPEFPGGEEAMFEFLHKNIKYGTRESSLGIEGKVVVNFVVDENGNISDCQVVRSLDYSFDQQVMVAVKKMPRWKPGKQNDRNVSVLFTLPVEFEQ